MQVATAPHQLDVDELYILSGLLQMPGEESYDLVGDLTGVLGWLRGAYESLQGLPLDEWQQAYIRLFVHRTPRAPCPPYESAYCQELEPGECAARTADLFARAGARILNMPPDFLGSELRLLAELVEDRTSDPRLSFLLWDRLRQWVPRFGADLERHAELLVYRALGKRLQELFA